MLLSAEWHGLNQSWVLEAVDQKAKQLVILPAKCVYLGTAEELQAIRDMQVFP